MERESGFQGLRGNYRDEATLPRGEAPHAVFVRAQKGLREPGVLPRVGRPKGPKACLERTLLAEELHITASATRHKNKKKRLERALYELMDHSGGMES
jgi:hypothetical protein